MKPTKIMIFDCGGTLINDESFDFNNGLKYLYNEVFNCKVSWDEFVNNCKTIKFIFSERNKSNIELNFQFYFNYLKFIYGLKTKLDFYEIEYEFTKRMYHTLKVEDASSLLEYLLNNNIKLYVFSNTMFSSNTVKKELAQYNLTNYFIDIQTSSEIIFRKPSPYVFNMMVKKFILEGYSLSDITYIGNDYNCDIVPSINAGINAIYKGSNNKKYEKYLEIKDFSSLLEMYHE